jgi:hypothetical protein
MNLIGIRRVAGTASILGPLLTYASLFWMWAELDLDSRSPINRWSNTLMSAGIILTLVGLSILVGTYIEEGRRQSISKGPLSDA